MSNATRRVLAMSLATALMLALVSLIAAQAGATTNTCKDVGFQNLEVSTSGPWGSVTFDPDEPVLELTVAAGYEVRLCIKAGSANQGLGPEVSDWLDEGVYSMTHSSGKDLSHFGILYRQTTTTTTSPEETTTSEDTTTTAPPETSSTTTTTPTTTSTTLDGSQPVPTTSVPTGGSTEPPPSGGGTRPAEDGTPETLPFTGVEDWAADWAAPLAAGLVTAGLIALSIAGRKEDLLPTQD